ncbi:MAG: DUF58 domain-containing protein, partial [Planctomycetota bacterium]
MPESNAHWQEAVTRGMTAAGGLRFALGERAQANVGSRLGDGPGDSIEFMDYRTYEPGDDLRRIDWTAFGRTDRVLVRRHLQEVSPNVEIIIDGSGSMNTGETPKAHATVAVAAALQSCALISGFSPRVLRAGARPEPLGGGVESLVRFPGFHGGGNLESLGGAGSLGATRVLLSDMLVPEPPESIVGPRGGGAPP